VGKTTALLDLFAQRPPDEKWAVLVNEFGQVGIDGPVLDAGGLQVKEVAGGCICCTAGLELRVGLVRLLREVRPDRLLIEPSGVARPATVVDVLRAPGLREAIAPRAVSTLVDPRAFVDPVVRARDAYSDQVLLADVLVGNWADRCTPEEVAAFEAEAAGLYPPKLVVATTSHGRLDPAWLDLDPARPGAGRAPHDHHAHHAHGEPRDHASAAGPVGPGRYAADGADASSCGWIWPSDVVFDRWELEEALQTLVHACDALPAGSLRIKGVFRTPRVVLLVHASPEAIRFEALNWRRDSRVEVLAPPVDGGHPAPDWDAVEALFHACRHADSGAS